MKSKDIILGVTASIAIYKACDIARRLFKEKFSVSVVMTANATRLISPQVFSSLIEGSLYPASSSVTKSLDKIKACGVYWDMFADPNDWKPRAGIEHVSLAKRAGMILIAPATANIIGKIACGIADDLLSTTIMATKAPVLIAPAMNANMYNNRIVQENIKRLKSQGYKFIGPGKGRLCCGDVGIGHLAEVEAIVKQARMLLK